MDELVRGPRRYRRRRRVAASTALVVVLLLLGGTTAVGSTLDTRSLDGSANNVGNPTWGQAGTPYLRVAAARYADGVGSQVGGANPRYSSNRIINDVGQNLFSERGVSQWGWAWGQFMDHTFGLAQGGSEKSNIAFDSDDPLEDFQNDFGVIGFKRSAAHPGTGTSTANPRQQTNTVSSYIDGFSVYGGTNPRLDWLRAGSCDGDPTNNSASLLTTDDGYLPRTTARTECATPEMAVDGQLLTHPEDAAVAGDVRGNENVALTSLHTLFAREHNRIVAALPSAMPEEEKFQIARRVVGAEQQYITYTAFLPALGINLPAYSGYKSTVNASLGNEFAAVAYRAHSMIHGEFEITTEANRYTDEQIEQMEDMGVEVEPDPDNPDQLLLEVPLNVAFFNPDLLPLIGLGPFVRNGLSEAQYKNDEQIDNALRSVLFQVPKPGVPDPSVCFEPAPNPDCFSGVVDLGAIDIQRGRDHGMPRYNDMRKAFGLKPLASFTAITAESTDKFPNDPEINAADPINDPDILDFVELLDGDGNNVPPGTGEGAVTGIRRTTLAARLKAVYGSVDNIDPFVGMISEKHMPGKEFGPLQNAVWTQQFRALRDGDRFFYPNDPMLTTIVQTYGITYQHTLSELIALNTDIALSELPANVFFAPEDD